MKYDLCLELDNKCRNRNLTNYERTLINIALKDLTVLPGIKEIDDVINEPDLCYNYSIFSINIAEEKIKSAQIMLTHEYSADGGISEERTKIMIESELGIYGIVIDEVIMRYYYYDTTAYNTTAELLAKDGVDIKKVPIWDFKSSALEYGIIPDADIRYCHNMEEEPQNIMVEIDKELEEQKVKTR